MRTTFRDVALASVAGVGAAALRLVLGFFPLTNLFDVVVFGLAGFGIGRTHPIKPRLSFVLLVVPTLMLLALFLVLLGPHKLRDGIGIAHLYGAVLVPLATGAGFFAGTRIAKRSHH